MGVQGLGSIDCAVPSGVTSALHKNGRMWESGRGGEGVSQQYVCSSIISYLGQRENKYMSSKEATGFGKLDVEMA
jgi:hypothetical protein